MNDAVQGHDPYDTPVESGTKYRYIRLGSGRLTEWDKANNAEIEHSSIIGKLERISEFDDEWDQAKGFPSEKLELIFEGRDSTYSVQTRIASGVCVRHLAGYLAHVAKGQVLALTADSGEKKVTFPKLHSWDGMEWKRIERVPFDDASKALESIRAHAAYADRPKRRTDADGKPDYSTPQDDFFSAAVAAGWPVPNGIEGAYCEVFTKALKRTVNAFSELSDQDWAKLEEGIGSAKSVPKALQSAVPTDGEYDPFAD